MTGVEGACLVQGLLYNRHMEKNQVWSGEPPESPTHNLTLSCDWHPWRRAMGVALGDSIPFSLHRDEGGPEELKGQNWELPLQDGESLL